MVFTITDKPDADLLLEINSQDGGMPINKEWLIKILKDSKTILATDNEPQGFAVVGWFKYDKLGLELNVLSVKTQWQRQGIGTALLQQVEELAREEGKQFIYVFTSADNQKARAFYTKNGFEPCGFLADRYGKGKHSEILRKNL